MAITDIQISEELETGTPELKSLMEGMRATDSRSYGPEELRNLFAGMRPEELETNAPSIKYRGNEGPKSPQEMEMMASMEAAQEGTLEDIYNELIELGMDPEEAAIKAREIYNNMSGGQPLPQDPTKPVNPFQPKPIGPVLPDRQMAAYGAIMGIDGRRKYGIGSNS